MKTGIVKSIVSTMSAVLLSGGLLLGQGVNDRQRHQQKRIRHGVKNEELTRMEARKLAKEQVHIQRLETRAKSDGEFTARDRAKLNREQNQASSHIYRQKHDRQERP